MTYKYVRRVIVRWLMLSPESPPKINSFNCQRSAAKPEIISLQKSETPWKTRGTQNQHLYHIDAVDGGSGIIGSHVAKLILYTSRSTSLSLMCISNRNQKCLQQKTIFHNGFSDYFLLCSKRVAFIHEHRSDGRAGNSWNPLPSTIDKKIDPVCCTYQPPHGAFIAIQSRN